MARSLLVIALIIGAVLAFAGGPIGWALVIMIGVPIVLVVAVGATGHEDAEHPHFAPARSQHPR